MNQDKASLQPNPLNLRKCLSQTALDHQKHSEKRIKEDSQPIEVNSQSDMNFDNVTLWLSDVSLLLVTILSPCYYLSSSQHFFITHHHSSSLITILSPHHHLSLLVTISVLLHHLSPSCHLFITHHHLLWHYYLLCNCSSWNHKESHVADAQKWWSLQTTHSIFVLAHKISEQRRNFVQSVSRKEERAIFWGISETVKRELHHLVFTSLILNQTNNTSSRLNRRNRQELRRQWWAGSSSC